ncbi:hypothetical protein BDN72DRAFT_413518 [Pluteus cervinus]|uniref:Uncharacterized protein n=1 Tax=Pluteus cervinus TaxID=181527 RepID=A0ACD3A947_9AGAR|nr:hypothetical protein BDN72DRAFT_413518 [Pluteus cervinus]
MPIWWGIFNKHYWFTPKGSWQHLIRSRESIEAATGVIPHLTNLREITTSRAFASPSVQCLGRIASSGLLQVFSKAIRDSGIIFSGLDILVLSIDLGYQLPDYPGLENDLRAIADCGRDSVTVCGFSLASKPGPRVSKVLSALGFFPKLSQLHLTPFASTGIYPTRMVVGGSDRQERLA